MNDDKTIKWNIKEVLKERNDAYDALSSLAFYLAVGSGDSTTSADEYHRRITKGIDDLLDLAAQSKKDAETGWENMRQRYYELAKSYRLARDINTRMANRMEKMKDLLDRARYVSALDNLDINAKLLQEIDSVLGNVEENEDDR
jgi:hypothetical protein